jgi:ribulose kinase
MKVKHLVVASATGHINAYTFDVTSWPSIQRTRNAIWQDQSRRHLMTLCESIEAQWNVQQSAEVRPSGIYGWFMGFFAAGEPAVHDQAIVELTQEVIR